jgi:serine/threonine protein kinase
VKQNHKSLNIGDTLDGRYLIEGWIGRGGMGNVYLAKDLKLRSKRWAVKECQIPQDQVESFSEEAEMLAKINHPKLPQLIDYWVSPEHNYTYLIMEYIEGPTLQDRFIQSGNSYDSIGVARIAIQICEIFDYLHGFQPKPIIYRDLKPSNVMIDAQQQVRLIDFGIARHYTVGQDADTVQLGTIGFAAPEQYAGSQSEITSDLYALGALMYYLLSGGEFAFRRRRPLHEWCQNVNFAFSQIIEQLLQESPQDRYHSANEVRKHLLDCFPQLKFTSHLSDAIVQNSQITNITVEPKLIAVGGLYSGVGTSFVGISLARCLNTLEIPHAYVEHPLNEPDLYMLLYGDKHAPKNYIFLSEWIKQRSTLSHPIHWEDGFTTWVPVSPHGFEQNWNNEDTLQLLHKIKKPISIWDISTQWREPSVIKLCQIADEIIVVVDASPGKINRPSSQKNLEWVLKLRAEGKSVRFLANRESTHSKRIEWMTDFPMGEISKCPEIPHSLVQSAMTKGICVQDDKAISGELVKAFGVWIQIFVSKERIHKLPLSSGTIRIRDSRKLSWIKKWFE